MLYPDDIKLYTSLQHVYIMSQNVSNNKLFEKVQHVVINTQYVVINTTTCCHNYMIEHKLTKDVVEIGISMYK